MADKLERTRYGRSTRTTYYGGGQPLEQEPKKESLLAWAIFIALLIGLVGVCWFGSIYVFGHPEDPFSYSLLKKLKKIEEPKRFLDTAGPRGKFLDAAAIVDRYARLPAGKLREENAKFLRSFVLNYKKSKDPVLYVYGPFKILDSYELTASDFVTSGVVALMQSTEKPQLLVEHIFPAEPKEIPMLHRSLLTGFDSTLRRADDLSAVLHVARLPDGRIKLTVMPLTYPPYATSQGPGEFALQPPRSLNIEAGLPILARERIEEADQRYAAYLRKLGVQPGAPVPKGTSTALVPVQPAAAVGDAPKVARALPANAPAATPARATPIPAPAAQLPPAPQPSAAATAPGSTPLAATESPPSGVPLKPFLATSTPQPAVNPSGTGRWTTYRPGQMPRGRLYGIDEAAGRVNQDLSGEPMYLSGEFRVSAAGPGRVVLRPPGSHRGVRVIVEFPRGAEPPEQNSMISRDGQRPFLVQRIYRAADGDINVIAREITVE